MYSAEDAGSNCCHVFPSLRSPSLRGSEAYVAIPSLCEPSSALSGIAGVALLPRNDRRFAPVHRITICITCIRLDFGLPIHTRSEKQMPGRQVVRQWILIPPSAGSNPARANHSLRIVPAFIEDRKS